MGVLAAGLVLAACGGDPEPTAATTSPSATATATPTPSATPSPSALYGIPEGASPFSGRPDGADKPVLAVKIDNTGPAQPHAGLGAADLVYVEEVEWDLTRFLAIYSSELPEVIGPVRSARISDIDILAPFGRVAFAYSGAQTRLLPVLAQANVIDASATANYTGWYNDPNRPSPVDHMIQPEDVMAAAGDPAKAVDIGFVFSDAPPAGGQSVKSLTVEWGSSTIEFRWDPDRDGYVVWINGNESRSVEGGPQVAANVVIQRVKQSDSGFGDRYGGKTPMIETIGEGTALVMRDGKLWTTTWERPTVEDGTTFTQSDGTPMPFAIGQQWVVFYDKELTPVVE